MAKNDSISLQVDKILNDYTVEVKRAAMNAIDSTAKESVQRLRQTSPVGRGNNAGEYAKSWSIKREHDKQKGLATVIVRNKDHYQLTHLLEHGHALPQGGRTKAQPHIAPVNDWAANEVVRRIEGNL